MRVYVLGGLFLSTQELVDNIKRFIPRARLAFEPDMEIVQAIKGLSRPLDERWARDEFSWLGQYPIERTIDDSHKGVERKRRDVCLKIKARG